MALFFFLCAVVVSAGVAFVVRSVSRAIRQSSVFIWMGWWFPGVVVYQSEDALAYWIGVGFQVVFLLLLSALDLVLILGSLATVATVATVATRPV
jgi:hypothetical protein